VQFRTWHVTQAFELLTKADELREFKLANRDKSIAELAREKRIGPTTSAACFA
jgi:hypothetical protein